MQRPFFAAALLASLTFPTLAADAPAPAPAAPAPATPVATPAAAPAPAAAPDAGEADKELKVEDSIVKLFIDTKAPNILYPWTDGTPSRSVATGVSVTVNGKNYLLVSGGSVNFVTKIESVDKTTFVVAFQGQGAQLALLEIKDAAKSAEFFKNHPPVALTESATTVAFAGYGAENNELAAIRGLAGETQVAAAGGSLGLRTGVSLETFRQGVAFVPAIADGKLAGIFLGAQLSEDKKSASAAFTPAAELKVFFADVQDGRYDGKWAFKNQMNFKPLINAALRAKMGLKADTEGLLVTGNPETIAPFKPQDILTAIGTSPVDNTGATKIAKGIKGSAFYMLNAAAKADTKTVPVTVLREGKSMVLDVPVMRRENELLPSLVERNAAPRYFVFGPLCFQQATAELAQAMVKGRGAELVLSGNPIGQRLNDNIKKSPNEEVVVLSNLFPHATTEGYASGGFPALKAVNGAPVGSLLQLAKLLADSKDEYLEFTFHDKDAETLVFKRAELLEASKEVRKKNGIVEICSEDLKDIVK